MLARLLAYLAHPATIGTLRKMGGAFAYAFLAAVGAAAGRDWHEGRHRKRP